MKIKGLMILAVVAAIISTSCTKTGISGTKVKTAEDSLAYSLGIANYFYYLSMDSMEIDPVLIAKGMLDSKNGENTLDEATAQGYVMMYMKRKQFGEIMDASEKYLEENKKREGVIETSSGLQYEVVTMGTGEKPAPTDEVKVHYTGTLVDGTKFDSSVDSGKPAVFVVNRVITGWQEALQLMPVGSKFKVCIPYELGYGENGAGPIPPYSTLLFEVELLEIIKK